VSATIVRKNRVATRMNCLVHFWWPLWSPCNWVPWAQMSPPTFGNQWTSKRGLKGLLWLLGFLIPSWQSNRVASDTQYKCLSLVRCKRSIKGNQLPSIHQRPCGHQRELTLCHCHLGVQDLLYRYS
jgi:hypothetical protein